MASLSTNVGTSVSSASRARSGKPRHAGMLSGDTAAPPRVIGPPEPDPADHRVDAVVEDLGHQPGQRPEHLLGALPGRGGHPGPVHHGAVEVDQADRELGAPDVDGEGEVSGHAPDGTERLRAA